MDFADKVKFARNELGISQEKMAAVLGVSFATVNRWERGKSKPSYEAQEKFMSFCKEKRISFEENF